MASSAGSLIRDILLCIDGEKWTEKAIAYAIALAGPLNGTLTALHVIDPYLKKFAHEIYAVGRREYTDHIDNELGREAEGVVARFRARVDAAGISYKVIVRSGPPEEEITSEIRENSYDLLILGAKSLTDFRGRFGSFNLPLKIFRKAQIPVMFVR
jgi:nucleotide-binding universal stress UspA family protein